VSADENVNIVNSPGAGPSGIQPLSSVPRTLIHTNQLGVKPALGTGSGMALPANAPKLGFGVMPTLRQVPLPKKAAAAFPSAGLLANFLLQRHSGPPPSHTEAQQITTSLGFGNNPLGYKITNPKPGLEKSSW